MSIEALTDCFLQAVSKATNTEEINEVIAPLVDIIALTSNETRNLSQHSLSISKHLSQSKNQDISLEDVLQSINSVATDNAIFFIDETEEKASIKKVEFELSIIFRDLNSNGSQKDSILTFVNSKLGQNKQTLKARLKGYFKNLNNSAQLVKYLDSTADLLSESIIKSRPISGYKTLDEIKKIVLECVISNITKYLSINEIRKQLEVGLTQAPCTSHPTLLLPVRIETRFTDDSLKIRIFPDQISINTHRDSLTATEIEAVKDYVTTAKSEPQKAWLTISHQFGATRAAWLVARGRDNNLPLQRDTEPKDTTDINSKISCLPDRFCVYAYRNNKVIRAITKPVKKDRSMVGNFNQTAQLVLTGDPGTTIPADSIATHLDSGIQWGLSESVTIDNSEKTNVSAYVVGNITETLRGTGWHLQTNPPIPGWHGVHSSSKLPPIEGLFDEKSKWVHDFETAVEDGFALEIPLKEDFLSIKGAPLGFDKIIVVGIQWNTAERTANQLTQLLESHRVTDGLGFIQPGSPTNNTESVSSSYSSTEDSLRLYSTYTRGEVSRGDRNLERTNAHRLARALGIDLESFRYCENSGDTSSSYAKEMNALTWVSTGDNYFRHLLTGKILEQQLNTLSDHQRDYVRGGGPLPSIRIGKQPYGILPVSCVNSSSKYVWHPYSNNENKDTDFDKNLYLILSNLFTHWLKIANNSGLVPHMHVDDPDPDSTLLKILSMQPQSVSFRCRPYIDPTLFLWLQSASDLQAFATEISDTYRIDLHHWKKIWLAYIDGSKEKIAKLLGDLADVDPTVFKNKPLLNLLAWYEGKIDPIPFTTKDDASNIKEYLVELIGSNGDNNPKPEVRLKSLLSHIAQCSLNLKKTYLNPDENSDTTKEISDPNDSFHILTYLKGIDPKAPPKIPNLPIFDILSNQPVCDTLFKESLDICSHRLDAWITSLATKRLDKMRSKNSGAENKSMGIHIGAYGFIENLKPHSKLSKHNPNISDGYIHAASSEQAATAAVLYNAFLTHDPNKYQQTDEDLGPNPFRINLTSTRVRHALRIINGMREGQSLGELLGYQFERSLYECNIELSKYIDDFRDLFPVVAHKVTPNPNDSKTPYAFAASSTLDGEALVKAYQHYCDESNWSRRRESTLWENIEDGDKDQIEDLLNKLVDSMDAVSDVLMTESVYQTVQGNFDRAGAVLASATGDASPPEIYVTNTPANGRKYSHRVCMLFNKKATLPSEDDPRAAAEPRIAAWFQDILGPLNQIEISYSCNNCEVGSLNLADLNLVDENCFSTTDFLYTAQNYCGGGASELEKRITQRVRKKQSLPDDETIVINDADASGENRSLSDAVQLAQQCLLLLSTGNALESHQLCHPGDVEHEGYSLLEVKLFLDRVKNAQDRLKTLKDEFSGVEFKVTTLLKGESSTVIPIGTEIKHDYSNTTWKTETESTLTASEKDDHAITVIDLILQANDYIVSTQVGTDWILITPIEKIEHIESITHSSPVNTEAVQTLLRKAAQFGIDGAITAAADDIQICTIFDNTYKEIRDRHQKVSAITTLVSAQIASDQFDSSAIITQLISAMKAIFGNSFIALPEFLPLHAEHLQKSLHDLDLIRQLGENRIRLWLQQAAEVQNATAIFEDTLMYTEAWTQNITNNRSSPTLEVAQVPHEKGRAWIALSEDEIGQESDRPDWHRSPLSLVIHNHGKLPDFLANNDESERMTAGLLIDEWSELLPSKLADTEVAFHYNAPGAQAPQALLLAVPGEFSESGELWTPEHLATIVSDTMDLAKVRGVDADALVPETPENGPSQSDDNSPPFGAILPGIYLPEAPKRPSYKREIVMTSLKERFGEYYDD